MTSALHLASIHLDGGRPEQALRALAPYVAANPTDGTALVLQARALALAGRHDEAVRAARSAATLHPDHVVALTTLSEVLRRAGEPEKAAEAALRAREMEPGSAEAHIQVAEASMHRRRTRAQAVAAAREAVRLAPHEPRAHDALGRSLLRRRGRRNRREAEAAIREALRLDPGEAVYLNNLGVALLAQRGRKQEALESFAAAARLDPSFDLPRTNTEGVIRSVLRLAVLLPAFHAVRVAVALSLEGEYLAAATMVAVIAAVGFVVARFLLPPAARRYLRTYLRVHGPTRERVRTAAVAATAGAAVVAASFAFPARDRLATTVAVQAVLLLAAGAWAATWRRVRVAPPPRPAPLAPRLVTGACDAVASLVVAVFLTAPVGSRADPPSDAWWLILPVWVAYLAYCDGVLGAAPLRRYRVVVVDAASGERIGFARGLLRVVAKLALWPLAPLAVLSRRRRAAHDLVTRSAVVRPAA